MHVIDTVDARFCSGNLRFAFSQSSFKNPEPFPLFCFTNKILECSVNILLAQFLFYIYINVSLTCKYFFLVAANTRVNSKYSIFYALMF